MVNEEKKLSRDEMRTAIFASKDIAVKVFTFFGVEVELHQPKLVDIINAAENPNSKSALLNALIRDAYVPGTTQRLFDDTDLESLMQLPFGEDFNRLVKALGELSDVNFPVQNEA